MAKAIREAKVHTSWVNPNGAYERAVASFIERALSGDHAGRFLQAFVPFARRVAALGTVNALAQVVLKLVSPGVPDIYQGTETWNLTLVDPDNRQAVDYAARRAALQSLAHLSFVADVDRPVEHPHVAMKEAAAQLLDEWPDGRLKLWVTTAGLRLRRARPGLFRRGEYVAAATEGSSRRHVMACWRTEGAEAVLAIVPRLSTSLRQESGGWPIGSDIWQDTRIAVPPRWSGVAFRDLLTGTTIVPAAGPDTWIPVGAALSVLPIALLWATRTRPPEQSPGPTGRP
jgi:(1->4)-alpha-D-glucan 1-alpha-D-glucosylmutase